MFQSGPSVVTPASGKVETVIPAVFCADRAYLPHLATAIASIARNSAEIIDTIYVVSSELTDRDIEVSLGEYRADVHVVVVGADAALTKGFWVSHHIAESTYLRFFLPELLPSTVTQALYLDCDTLVLSSLQGLVPFVEQLNTSLEQERPLLAAAWRESASPHLKEHGFTSENYFNAGVLLLNIQAMRVEGTSRQLANLTTRLHEKLRWWDQDVLNLVFQDRWLLLPGEYNFVRPREGTIPKIAHFSGSSKPWMWGCKHPLRSEYRKYRRFTTFYPFRKSNFLPALSKSLRSRRLRTLRRKLRRVVREIARTRHP